MPVTEMSCINIHFSHFKIFLKENCLLWAGVTEMYVVSLQNVKCRTIAQSTEEGKDSLFKDSPTICKVLQHC